MRISALITALALTGAVAAAQAATSTTHDTTANTQTTATTADTPHEGLGAKLKRGLHRMGDATRNAMHRVARAGKKDKSTDTAAANDTRSMGASGTESKDDSRKNRMDGAYDNYKTKQK